MVSIIIVNYHVKNELFACIESVIASKPKTKYEIIIVDNDEEKTIEKELHEMFSEVNYVPNNNMGFGQGNNVGAKHAKGEFLFFLNPDTEVFNDCVDSLINYLQGHIEIGIVAPVLCHEDNKPFILQGLGKLTPFSA